MKVIYYVLALTIMATTGMASHISMADVAPYAQVREIDEAVRIDLEAPAKAKIGELVRLNITSEVESIKWLLIPDSVDFQVYDDGRRAVFSARRAGDYLFIVAVSKGGQVDVVTHTVTVIGPPTPPTTQDLTDWIVYWCASRDLDAAEAVILATSFEDVADRITPLSTTKGIIAATSESNREAMGKSLTVWKPVLSKIQSVLKKRAAAGELTSPEHHITTWREIAEGLRRYGE